jgi:hypothetical protein
MGITTSKSPWSLERGNLSNSRPGVSPQSSGGNRADGGHLAHGLGKDCSTRRDMPVEQPRDGNRIVEPVARDRR